MENIFLVANNNEYLRSSSQAGLSDGLNYFLIFLMFFLIIAAVIFFIMFAKWLTVGPKLKKRWNKLFNKVDPNAENGIKIKGKEVVVDDQYIVEIEKSIAEAKTPQELLEQQIKLENHNKQKLLAEEKIKKDEQEKLEKLESKEERKKLNTEAKQTAKELKKQEKERKKQLKNKESK